MLNTTLYVDGVLKPETLCYNLMQFVKLLTDSFLIVYCNMNLLFHRKIKVKTKTRLQKAKISRFLDKVVGKFILYFLILESSCLCSAEQRCNELVD